MFKKEYHPLDSRHADNRRATANVAAKREAVRLGGPVLPTPTPKPEKHDRPVPPRDTHDTQISAPAPDDIAPAPRGVDAAAMMHRAQEALRDRISKTVHQPEKPAKSKSILRRVLGLPFALIRGILRLYRNLMIAYAVIALVAVFSILSRDGGVNGLVPEGLAQQVNGQGITATIKDALMSQPSPFSREVGNLGTPLESIATPSGSGATQAPFGSSAKFSAAPKPQLAPESIQ